MFAIRVSKLVGLPLISNFFNYADIFLCLTDRVFGPDTITEEVYEVAARPVVKSAMEGINGMLNMVLNAMAVYFIKIEPQVRDC